MAPLHFYGQTQTRRPLFLRLVSRMPNNRTLPGEESGEDRRPCQPASCERRGHDRIDRTLGQLELTPGYLLERTLSFDRCADRFESIILGMCNDSAHLRQFQDNRAERIAIEAQRAKDIADGQAAYTAQLVAEARADERAKILAELHQQ